MSKQYTYQFNGRDGTFDLIEIVNPAGTVIATLYYWDEPDTDEAKRVVESACVICENLNHWHIGEDDWRELTPEEVREHEKWRIAQQQGGQP
jgi:hypothetical protein